MLFRALILFLLCSFTPPAGMHYQHFLTDTPQSIHMLEVDPNRFSIQPARALDQCVGRETVLSLATRKGAIAAFNGGFFSAAGFPSGILKIDGKWYGLALKPRGAIGWSSDGNCALYDRLLTHLEGLHFRVESQTGYTTAKQWELVEHIVGGTPLLIQAGKKIGDYSAEKTIETFLTLRHARTAVGLLPNGHWLFVVVDGGQGSYSLGMTMGELADFMESQGCVQALNLDGGGSTTFVYQGRVVNEPVGDEDDDNNFLTLRPVSDAILILPR